MAQKSQLYTNKFILDLLQKMPVFNMFSQDEIRTMLYSGELVRIERFGPGETIIEEGSYGKWVYILIRGSIRVVKKGAELCTLTKLGEVIGEIGAVNDTIRSASVETIKDSVFISINLAAVEHLPGAERGHYLEKIQSFFMPIIENRLQMTLEVTEIMEEIQKKKAELVQLEQRLKELGVSEEKSVLELILSGAV